MKPILYEKNETAFTSNGLGRLNDCVACSVTEELNGIYECDITYPVTGQLFDEIQLGRIIAVSHDDGGQLEPFDIVSYSKPIDGVVSFHAVHISYRLTKYITKRLTPSGVSSIGGAITMFNAAVPTPLPFTFFNLATSTGQFMAMTADDTPRSVREFIGGGEGCLLDAFGVEVAWSRFTVGFYNQRGKMRDFAIRYGVNMTNYNEQVDGQETFTMAVPFWKNGDTVIVGSLVDSGLPAYDRPTAIALDLSGSFEDEPTTAQLEAEALAIMTSGAPNLPKRSIEVDFIRLQDLEDYAGFDNLLECNLGDSLTVIFPAYNMQGSFRIVKVVWDALRERFETMTLGTLETTLAEALGVGGGVTTVGGGGGGSTVTWTQITSTGTKIAEISINGTSTDVYAPSGGGSGPKIFFGTCETAAATAAKVVDCAEFTAADYAVGNILFVWFQNSNSVASPTINVNSTGAATIYRYGTTKPSTSASSSWNAGAVVCFICDGTNWTMENWLNTTYSAISQANIESLSGAGSGLITGQRMTDGVAKRVKFTQITSTGTKIGTIEINGTATDIYAPSGGGTQNVWRGTCDTAENTAAKIVTTTGGGFTLAAGNIVFVTFDHRLYTASTSLNVDGTGAKTIKQNGAAPQLGIWQDGETVGFVYDGTNFELFDGGMASTTDWGVTKLSSSVSDGFANIAANGAAVKTAYDLAVKGHNLWYGTCTRSGTSTFVATTAGGDFSLTAGSFVFLQMQNQFASTGTATLNVDGTGAKTIVDQSYVGISSYQWNADETVGFVYDGTYFVLLDSGYATTTNWGETKLSSSTSSSSESLAATPKAVKAAYDLANGKSTVAWNQIQSTGMKIAEITIDGGSPTDIYAPTGGGGDTVTASAQYNSGTKIATITVNGSPVDIYVPVYGGGVS